MLEENLFKSCLKRRVTFTTSTLVKFLITGMVALSLTACGGGGGGSSSSGGNIQKPTVENNKTSEKGLTTENENFINKGKVDLTGNKTNDSVVGIVGKDSYITNEAEIKINDISKNNSKILLNSERGKDILNVFQEQGKSFAIFAEGGKVTNDKEGKLNITGDNVTGIVGVYSDIVNNGTIFTSEKIEDTEEATGILAMGSNVENNGDITLVSYDGTGIYAMNNIKDDEAGIEINSGKRISVINNKTISVKGEESRGIVAGGNDIDVINNGKLSLEGIDVDGIVIQGDNNSVKNGKDGEIIVTNNGTKKDHDKIEYISGINIKEGNKNTVINEGKITVSINTNDGVYVASGINSDENVEIINSGTITINSKTREDNFNEEVFSPTYLEDFSYGIKTNGKAVNKAYGTINITGTAIGMRGKEIVNEGTINIAGVYKEIVSGNNLEAVEEKDYKIPIGIAVIDDGATAVNKGKIIIDGKATNKEVLVSGYSAQGMFAFGGATVINENLIEIKNGFEASAMNGEMGIVINKGNIILSGSYVNGAEISGGIFENYGIIDVKSNTSDGVSVEDGGQAFNKAGGVINVDGEGSYGMAAYGQGSKVINEKGGTINVNGVDASGMYATDGGKVENYGTININESTGINSEEEAKKHALNTANEADITNSGIINFKGKELAVKTDENSSYTIGTNKDGSYGKISAEKVTVDGNVKVSAEIAKEGYQNSYVFDDVVSGKTELGENYKVASTSVLYNAVSKTDEKGNLDAELIRNDKNIADFTDKNFVQAAGIFDKAMSDEEYRKTLSESEKELLEKVFDKTGSGKDIDKAIKEISGYEYGNIARQMFDTKDMFKSYDKSIINSLGDYNFNFNFIGNYADVDSKHGIAGYDSKITGIAGAMKFTDSLYGVIGYGYNDIDYDGNSDGNIQTIHTGVYKDIKSSFVNIRLGVFGEYNFHETDREVLGEKAESDFNSYLVGTEAEISKKYGDDLYFKPALSLDITYGKYEDFTESKASDLKVESQDYVSVVPAIELRAGKVFGMSEVYSAVKYSYEFGDMNKSQDMKLFDKFTVENDNIENAQTDLKIGTLINIKNISVNAEIGKEFGNRDREYIKAGFTYTF